MFCTRVSIILCTILFSGNCYSEVIGFPSAPTNTSSIGDEVRSRDGVLCKGSNSGPMLDVGGSVSPRSNYYYFPNATSAPNAESVLQGYVRVVIPLGDTTPKVDCNRLYELEIQRLQMELKILEQNKNSKVIVK